jgi:hypothetical protein
MNPHCIAGHMMASPATADSAGTDVWVGLDADPGSQVLWYRSRIGRLSPAPGAFPVEGTVTRLCLGQLGDDNFTDVAIVAGGQVSILHWANPRAGRCP